MKRVFSSNSQLAHVWANQSQSSGRANNMYFEGKEIYSYGDHYLAAQIHEVKGERFALVRSDTYSQSTSGHLAKIRSACNGLIPFFCVPGHSTIQDPKLAVKIMDERAQNSIASALKKMKVTNERGIKWHFEMIHDAFKEANELRKFLGRVEVWPKKAQLDEVNAHLRKRLVRYRELNTPEMIAKRQAESEKRAARKAELAQASQAEKIEAWRRGEYHAAFYGFQFDLLRVKGNEVITSRGARVPLDQAVAAYRRISKGEDCQGLGVGHFMVNHVDKLAEDRVVKVGCHKILLSEAAKVLGPYVNKGLTVVQGGAA